MKFYWGDIVFYCLLLAVPLTYLPIVPDPAHSVVYVWLSLAMIIYSLAMPRQNIEIQFNLVILVLIIAYLSITILSWFFSPKNSEVSLEGFRVLFFVSSYFFLSINRRLSEYIPKVIVGLGILFLGFGIYDYIICYNPIDIYHGLYDIRAHIGHKNLCSIFLTMSFPFAYRWAKEAKQIELKYGLFLYISLATLLVILFRSRIGLLGIAINLMALIYYQRRRVSWKYSFLIALVLLFSTHLLLRNNSTYNATIHRIYKSFTVSGKRDKDNQSISERWVLWSKTAELIKDYPLAGVGLGQWKIHILSKDINDTRAKFGNIIFQQPHNDFLWVAAELGIIAGIVYLAIFIYALYILFRKRSKLTYPYLIALIILFLASLVDFPKERPIFLFFFAFLLANATSQETKQIKGLRYIILFVLFILQLFFINRIVGEIQIMELLHQRKLGNQKKVIDLSQNIQRLHLQFDHTSTPIDFYSGEAYFLLKKLDISIAYFHSSLRLNPYHLYTWNNMAGAYLQRGDDLNAVIAWNKAIDIARGFAEPRLNLANYYLLHNDILAAENILHFDMEDDDGVRYRNELLALANKLIVKQTIPNTPQYREQLDAILSDDKRKLWLMKQFCRNTLDFKTQLINDIEFVLEKNTAQSP